MADGAGDRTERISIWNAREIARRNQSDPGRPLSPVMKTAVTACELAHGSGRRAGRRSD